ncbi:MAG: 30S ribosomal protein S14 [Myxococcota bacterium]
MAKTSQIYRDRRRESLIRKYASRRAELRKQLRDPRSSMDEKFETQAALEKLPRNSCPTRLTRRCLLTGRSRGGYQKFKLSRIMFRQLALEGKMPGVTKSSW